MATTILKEEIESETCSVCGGGGDLFTPEEHDAGSPMQVPLRTMLLQLNNNKVIPDGKLCVSCIRRALEAYEFSTALSTRTSPPLSEKIRALRRKLHELTQKVDVFIVVGGSQNPGGVYSQDDIIMVDKNALAAAAAADDEDMEKARNACGDSVYQCTICPQSFQHASEYREHVATHPSGARHCCWTCGAQFTSKEALKDHTLLHAVSLPTQGLVCNLCSVAFQNSTEMRRHEATCATCPVCAMRCGARSTLAAHARRSHARAPPLLCALCFTTLPSADVFAAHALSHRQAERFVCGYDACILRFANRNDLLAHIRKCHGGEPAPAPAEPAPPAAAAVACDHCGRTFGSVAAMKRHARVHRRETQQEEVDWEGGEIEKTLSRMHGIEPLEEDVEYLEMETLEEM